MSWLDFVAKVREINNTADEEGVRNIAFYLNESVEVTEFFRNRYNLQKQMH